MRMKQGGNMADILFMKLQCKDGDLKLYASALSSDYQNILKGYDVSLHTDCGVKDMLHILITVCQSHSTAVPSGQQGLNRKTKSITGETKASKATGNLSGLLDENIVLIGTSVDDPLANTRDELDKYIISSGKGESDRWERTCPDISCLQKFGNNQDFVNHLATHNEQIPFMCQYCDESFFYMTDVEKHIADNHAVSSTCTVCQKVFGNVELLIGHNCEVRDASNTETGVTYRVVEADNDEIKLQIVKSVLSNNKDNSVNDATSSNNDSLNAGDMDAVDNEEFVQQAEVSDTDRTISNIFKCPKPRCGRTFVNEKDLRSHIEEFGHDCKGRAHKCHVCGTRFRFLSSLTRHLKIHKQSKAFACELCVKSFDDGASLKKHAAMHFSEKRYNCKYCDKTSASKSSLFVHTACHTNFGKEISEVIRKDCKATYKATYREILPKDEIADINEVELLAKSDVTDAKDNSESKTKDHTDNSDTTEYIDVRLDGKDIFKCPIPRCLKIFSNDDDLQAHIKDYGHKVNSDLVYGCDICGIRFKYLSSHKRHMKMHCENEVKPFACKLCAKSFSIEKSLHRHLRLHFRERQFKCKHCEMTFRTKNLLYVHTASHAGVDQMITDVIEKDYAAKKEKIERLKALVFKCENHCNKLFNTQKQLDNHCKSISNEKPKNPQLKMCHICSKTARNTSDLRSHMVIHSNLKPYRCVVCGTRFARNSQLKRHSLLHTGERKYQCETCGMFFASKTNHTKHSLVHLNREERRQFTCSYCPKVYLRCAALKKHMQNVHSIKYSACQ